MHSGETISDETREKIEQLVKASGIYAAEQVSWFAPALYAAQLVITEGCPAPAGIDKHGRVYFNPQWIARLRERCKDNEQVLSQVGFLWFHEICHWIREHWQRAEDIHAQPALWNLATDMEINDHVPDGLAMPDFGQGRSGVLPRGYNLPDGQTAEWYYRHLQQQAQQVPSQQGGDSQSGARSKQTAQAGTSSTLQQHSPQAGQASAPQQHSPQAGQSQQDGNTDTAAQPNSSSRLDEGSGIDGQSRGWELSAENEEPPALSDFDRQSLAEEVAHRILDAQKTRGIIPAGWLRWAEEILKPRVDWRKHLQRAVRGAISEGFGQRIDYSWRRPNRRSAIYAPFILPSLQGEYKPRVVCIVDTSGSIGQDELAQALAEVRGVLEQLRVPITVIPCDAVPYEAIQVLTRSDWLKVQQGMRGSGGTDMVAGLNAALQMKPTPEAVIVLTDGYTPFPKTRPKRTQVIWAIWSLGGDEPPTPPCPPWRKRDIVTIPIKS